LKTNQIISNDTAFDSINAPVTQEQGLSRELLPPSYYHCSLHCLHLLLRPHLRPRQALCRNEQIKHWAESCAYLATCIFLEHVSVYDWEMSINADPSLQSSLFCSTSQLRLSLWIAFWIHSRQLLDSKAPDNNRIEMPDAIMLNHILEATLIWHCPFSPTRPQLVSHKQGHKFVSLTRGGNDTHRVNNLQAPEFPMGCNSCRM
jgi:hypothetical protein